jgi:dihydropteroate synthase
MIWQTARFQIDLSRPRVMGIVNVTPDSFSDGGRHANTRAALAHAEQLLSDGAHILDIGGESTRPGAAPVTLEDELARVLPVLREALKFGVPLSIDTYKPEVMQAALDAGADIINDVWALRWQASPQALAGPAVVAAHASAGVCLMHMHRDPASMQVHTMAGDVVPQVLHFLEHQSQYLHGLGVQKSRIVWDMGIGFGKTVAQNFTLLARQSELCAHGYPVLAGWSRKSSLGAVTGLPDQQAQAASHPRMVPSVAAALLAVARGARVVRVHDVKETVQALQVWQAMHEQES